MNANHVSIVLYGHDIHLLELRRWFLHSCGYRVFSAMSLGELDALPQAPPIQLLTLCHTLSPAECVAAAAVASSRWPAIKKLAFVRDGCKAPAEIRSEVFHPFDAPAHLLAMVSELVGHSVSSPHAHTY